MTSGQGAHGGGDLRTYRVRQRGVADLGRRGLAGRAGRVREEGLQHRQAVRRVALLADDLVRHQDDRVRTRLLGVVVDLEYLVVGAGPARRGAGDGLARRVAGQVDELTVGVADLGHLQVVRGGERPLDVPDGAVVLAQRRGHAVRALLRVAARGLPGLVVREGPAAGGRGGQVLGEVVGGTRAVRAVHREDLGGRQGGARVVRGDHRVVPGGHLSGENLGDGRRLELQAAHAADVVDHRDRADHQDRKSTRLNSSHSQISYAVFCLKKKEQYV